MSEPNKYREWILETIDSLRSRKARPDLDRICRMVQRRHGSDPDRTRTELEKLIQEQTVLKVSYKGSISYRNAAKVQRRSRKRSESGGGPDATRERSEPEHPSSNAGDSAHSSTDPEEGETEPEPRADDPEPQSGSSPGGGHGRLGCVVATSRADCEEETASGRWGAGVSRGAAAGEPGDGSQNKPVSRSQTPAGGDGQAQVWSELRSKPTHRQGGCERREPTAPSDRTQRGGGSAGRGHVKPLDLKEILGYLSSQERLSEEKLTRGKVKAVMEREVERGRLRRTRCGDITLPLRGVGGPPSADGLGRSAPRDQRAGSESSPACPDSTPMETAGGEDEEEKDGDADPRSSDEDRALSPVAMTTEAGHTEKSGEDAGFQGELKAGSPQQQRQDGEPAPLSEMSELDFPPGSRSPPASWSECNGASSEKGAFSSDHLSYTQREDLNLTSSSFHNAEYKTEVGASSCMLTPTASPRDPGIPEERGVSDGSGGLMKFDNTRVSPVDWTVSDVVSYFTAVGFPEQAAAFRTQEIDGKSLLLMQRNDVLTGLSIKLGPALKIYERHVKVLQNTHFEENDCYQDAKDTLRLLC